MAFPVTVVVELPPPVLLVKPCTVPWVHVICAKPADRLTDSSIVASIVVPDGNPSSAAAHPSVRLVLQRTVAEAEPAPTNAVSAMAATRGEAEHLQVFHVLPCPDASDAGPCYGRLVLTTEEV